MGSVSSGSQRKKQLSTTFVNPSTSNETQIKLPICFKQIQQCKLDKMKLLLFWKYIVCLKINLRYSLFSCSINSWFHLHLMDVHALRKRCTIITNLQWFLNGCHFFIHMTDKNSIRCHTVIERGKKCHRYLCTFFLMKSKWKHVLEY